MTNQRSLWIASGGSLLIQAWFIGLWWWMSAGCFCSTGDGLRELSDEALALAEIVIDITTYPIEHVLPHWFTRSDPVTLGAANFHVWFAAFYLPLRTWMLLRGVRRPVEVDSCSGAKSRPRWSVPCGGETGKARRRRSSITAFRGTAMWMPRLLVLPLLVTAAACTSSPAPRDVEPATEAASPVPAPQRSVQAAAQASGPELVASMTGAVPRDGGRRPTRPCRR